MITDNFLKQELESEAKKTRMRRLRLTLATSVFVLVIGSGSIAWAQSRPSYHGETDEEVAVNEQSSVATNPPQNTPDQQDKPKTPTAATESQGNPGASASSTAHTWKPVAIDKSAYVADANKVMGSYSQIVKLLTFGSISESEKISRIKQAATLNKKSFRQVTDLRTHLVMAEVTSGPYVQATELAESGVSKISVGVEELEAWSTGSSTASFNGANGLVAQGASILLQFSSKVESL